MQWYHGRNILYQHNEEWKENFADKGKVLPFFRLQKM